MGSITMNTKPSQPAVLQLEQHSAVTVKPYQTWAENSSSVALPRQVLAGKQDATQNQPPYKNPVVLTGTCLHGA